MAMDSGRSPRETPQRLLREWDWRLLGVIFLFLALPHFYRSYSIYLIGNSIPDTGALATVAQWGFVELLLEVIQETFVLAIFFFVGRSVIAGRPGESIRTAVTLVFWASIIVAGVLITFSGSFVDVIGTPDSIQETTTSFLRVKIAAIPITLLTAAIVIIVETVNRKRLILTVALANVGYRFVFDSVFYGGYTFSLGLGVMGVAWADVFASLSLLITAVLLLRRHLFDDVRTWREFFSVSGWRTYLGVSTGSGIDSLVRNVAYFFLIVRLLNLPRRGCDWGLLPGDAHLLELPPSPDTCAFREFEGPGRESFGGYRQSAPPVVFFYGDQRCDRSCLGASAPRMARLRHVPKS